jgi:hypothetical protein
MNAMNPWIESVFIKRAILALVAGIVSHLVAYLAAPAASHAFSLLDSIGLSVTIVVDQVKFG